MEPDDPTLLSRRGHLFGLINFSPAIGPAGTHGRHLIDQINEIYYASPTVDITTQLRETLTSFSQLPNGDSSQLSLILAVVVDGQLTLAIFNSGRCFLQRGQQISLLLSGQPDLVTTISGQSLDADRLLLCTDAFFGDFTWENIKSSLASPNLDDIEENFLSRLYSLNNQSQLAGALVEIHDDPGEHQEIISPPPSPPSETAVPDSPKTNKSLFSFIHQHSHPSFITHVDYPTVNRRKKINLLLALLILAALFISIYFGYRRNLSQSLETQYQSLKTQIQAKITNAQAVKSLSLSDALTQSQEAQKLLQQISPYQKNHLDEITQLQQTVSGLLSQTGSSDSYNPELFFDTSLINNGLPYSGLTLSGNNLYLLDSVNGHIDKLDISNKSHQNIATADDIKNSQFVAENSGVLYILKNNQILSVQSTQTTPKINLLDQIKDFTVGEFHFWNGSLYVLSSGGSPSIWKYSPNPTGFIAAGNWLKSKQTLPANPVSFAINGNIWVLSQSGIISPYNLGIKADYKQTAPALTNAANLVTSLDSNLLAFTDQGNQVYVYNKSGQSIGKYNYGNRKILGLAYDQTDNLLLVLCDDKKLYKISL
jgi:hypothetical protein